MKYSIKTIILLAAMGIISYSTMAQKTNMVPQAVLTAFSVKYPQADLKKWKTQNKQYVASFTLDKKKCMAFYSPNGNWLNTQTKIGRVAKLPVNVKATLKKSNYASWYVDEIEYVQTPSQNMYMLKVDNDNGNTFIYENNGLFDNKTLCFSTNGKLLKTIADN